MKILIIILVLSFSAFAQDETLEQSKLYDYLAKNGVTKQNGPHEYVEKDGVICRMMTKGFAPGSPECGLVKDYKEYKKSAALLKNAIGTTIGAGIICSQLIDEKDKFSFNCGSKNGSYFKSIVSEGKCRYLQRGLVRVHRPKTRSCSQDSSICIGTIQCEGQGPSTAACAPKDGECSQTADECVADQEVKQYKKYGMGLLDEEESPKKSTGSKQ